MRLSTGKQLVLAIPLPVRVGLLLVLLALSSVASFLYVNRPRPAVLTDKDTILLTEFENRTGEAIFDGALRQGLLLQLQQSPFLDLCPDERIQQTLRQLKRTPAEPVTRDIGREIARQQGVKAVIVGALAKPDRYYLLTVEALDSQTGARLILVQTEAESRDAVLTALTQAAAEVRSKLGEKLITVRRYAAPLEVTLSSIEALKAYTLAYEAEARGKYQEAIPLYQRVLALDDNSTIAYRGLAAVYDATQQPALAREAATKAYDLREGVGELENFRLTFLYHSLVTGNLEKCLEVLKQQQQVYPRDLSVYANLASTYRKLGQFELADETAAEALRLKPNPAMTH
jgi:eukaryotic-like serine/threonine-protein kinase